MMEARRVASPSLGSDHSLEPKEGNQLTTSPWNPVRPTSRERVTRSRDPNEPAPDQGRSVRA